MTGAESTRGEFETAENGTLSVRFVRRLDAAPAEVWTRLVDRAARESWLPGSELEPRSGGAVRVALGGDGTDDGAGDVANDGTSDAAVGSASSGEDGVATGSVLLALAPGATGRLVHTWLVPGAPDSVVLWTLEPDGDATRLELVHRDLDDDQAADVTIGWHAVLDALALALAGDEAASATAWAGLDEIAGRYAAD